MEKINVKEQFQDIPRPSIIEESTQGSMSKGFDTEEVWKIVWEHIKMNTSQRIRDIWFKGLYLEKIEAGIALFSCEDEFKREWVESNHRILIKKSLLEATGHQLEIAFRVRSSIKHDQQNDNYQYYDPKSEANPLSMFSKEGAEFSQSNQIRYRSQLNPKYTFETFIVGAGNSMAHAIAEAVVEKPGLTYNPVFIYGRTGVGKTHLMQAIGNEFLNRVPSKKVFYCSSEQFLHELIEGIRTRTTHKFRDTYRKLDLLLLDDIQFVVNSPKTQEELFHTFNTLYQANKQIVMASDRPPREIENLTDRLRSRFEGGMVVDIQSPDYETKMAILQQKVLESSVTVPQEYIDFIAQNIESNVRQLEGAITKLITTMKYSPEPITQQHLAQMLALDIESKRRKVKPTAVIDAVSKVFDLNPRDIKGNRRTSYLALGRQVVMYLLRKELELPLEKIAKEVNRKDHTTVLYAFDKIKLLIETDPQFKAKIEKCRDCFDV